MRLLAALASALACGASLVEAKAVFAHFMVSNTKSLGLDDWRTEIGLAQGAGIDAFVLNIANEDSTNNIAIPIAFTAAYDMGFQLLFSFDYAGNGAWDKVVCEVDSWFGQRKRLLEHLLPCVELPSNTNKHCLKHLLLLVNNHETLKVSLYGIRRHNPRYNSASDVRLASLSEWLHPNLLPLTPGLWSLTLDWTSG
ncbi:hypothetical protein FE257_012788 [Aspergillus nanangensis]|uniref:Glycoside hydrolase family 71 protein n=1 Tax=Aspergillus nanangensis TaxID=2582783 RepID=A0AAD4GQK1_ASPNN|nr:hypothetical protein FE257_012788 [Aspergillus nanangensis]